MGEEDRKVGMWQGGRDQNEAGQDTKMVQRMKQSSGGGGDKDQAGREIERGTDQDEAGRDID